MTNIPREALVLLLYSSFLWAFLWDSIGPLVIYQVWRSLVLCIPKQLSQHQADVWSMQTRKSPILSPKPQHLSFMVQLFSVDAVLWKYTSVQPGWGPSTIARFTTVYWNFTDLNHWKSEKLEHFLWLIWSFSFVHLCKDPMMVSITW